MPSIRPFRGLALALLIAVLGVIRSPIVASSQDPPPPSQRPEPPTFRTTTDLLTIDAVVTDGDGRHVTDLTAEDFEVTISGKRQALQLP